MELAVFVIKTEEKTYLLYNDEADIIFDKDSETEISDEDNKVGITTQPLKSKSKPSRAGHAKPRGESSSPSESTPSNEEDKEEAQRGSKQAAYMGHSRRIPKRQEVSRVKQEGTNDKEQEEANKKKIELEQELRKYSQPLPKKHSTKLINKTLNNVIEAMCGMRKRLLENVLNKVGKSKKDIVNEANDKISIELIKLASLDTPFGEEMTKALEKMHNTKH